MSSILLCCVLGVFGAQASLSSGSVSAASENVLPDECEFRLQSFANETAKFTLCVITHARPITVCENCVNEYNLVLTKYGEIQKLQKNQSEVDCRAVLTNIDRLQVVYASYRYVFDLWEDASCKLCLNNTVLNEKTNEVMKRGKFFSACVSNHKNGTEPNSTLCSDCKKDYEELIDYYNSQKLTNEFCMDVVDMINNTQSDWSLLWKCHVSNYNSEWILLAISISILLMPVLFYLANWLLSKERSNVLLSQSRWHGRFTNTTTAGYIVIS